MREADAAMVYWVLSAVLPLVPAFLLFKYLPSRGEVSGPMHGLQLKLGGSFAGYFIVFLCLLYARPKADLHFHTWTVVGSVTFVHPPDEPEPNTNDVLVRVIPPTLGVMNGGAFTWQIPVVEDADGNLHFPDLQFDMRGYRGMTIPLSPNRPYGAPGVSAKYDDDKRTLSLTQPLSMQSSLIGPKYVPSGAPPLPLPTPIK